MGPFTNYVIKEVSGWGSQMMMFDNKGGGWGWLNADVSKKYTRKRKVELIDAKDIDVAQPIWS